ncbi:BatA domain-containing protein [Candidatus Uabimicrobium sp. HlEnr_7]|uniref:BatA domain-containing protein n=1 Tax=Candidatus Uabimicrobium helgolandensis TaxID=3095367 RepID=UPI0035574842
MNFLYTHYLWFSAILVLPIILKLRKKKYENLAVPHLQFWLQENEVIKHSTWKFSVRELLYILPMLLLFIAANLSLTEPYYGELNNKNPEHIVLVDTSVSMKTQEKFQSRLQQVQSLLSKMPLKNKVIFTTHKVPKVITTEEIGFLEVEESNLQKSVSFVENFYNKGYFIVFTDGANKDWPRVLKYLRTKYNKNLIVKTIGNYQENAGLYLKKIDNNKAIVHIYHDYSKKQQIRLLWGKVDSEELQTKYYQKKVSLIPNKGLDVELSVTSGKWDFRLEIVEALEEDNRIFQYIHEQKKCKVLVLSDKDVPKLVAALGVYQDFIDLTNSSFQNQTTDNKFFDIAFVHLDKWQIPKNPNFKKLVLWNTKGNFLPYRSIQVKENNNFRGALNEKLMHNVDFSLLTTEYIDLYTHNKKNLLMHPSGAAIWQSKYQNIPFVYIGFSLHHSNIHFLPSFPIFIKNLIKWATPKQQLYTKFPTTQVTLKSFVDDNVTINIEKKPDVEYLQWYVVAAVYLLMILCIFYFWR